jgi:hypothetical protein
MAVVVRENQSRRDLTKVEAQYEVLGLEFGHFSRRWRRFFQAAALSTRSKGWLEWRVAIDWRYRGLSK